MSLPLLDGKPSQITVRAHYCRNCDKKFFMLATPNHCPYCGDEFNLISFNTVHEYKLVETHAPTEKSGVHSQGH